MVHCRDGIVRLARNNCERAQCSPLSVVPDVPQAGEDERLSAWAVEVVRLPPALVTGLGASPFVEPRDGDERTATIDQRAEGRLARQGLSRALMSREPIVGWSAQLGTSPQRSARSFRVPSEVVAAM